MVLFIVVSNNNLPVFETNLSDEELMRLSLSDIVKKSKLNTPGFIEQVILELDKHSSSGGNYFEFFYEINKAFGKPKEDISFNQGESTMEEIKSNNKYWRIWRIKDLMKKNNCNENEAIIILNTNIKDKLLKKLNKTQEALESHNALMRKRIKTAQLYAKYDFMQYPEGVNCIVFDVESDTHKEYNSHKVAAKDIGCSLSNVVISYRDKCLVKKKYGVIIIRGIKEHKHLKQEDND